MGFAMAQNGVFGIDIAKAFQRRLGTLTFEHSAESLQKAQCVWEKKKRKAATWRFYFWMKTSWRFQIFCIFTLVGGMIQFDINFWNGKTTN